VIIGDAFTDVAVPQHLITQEFFELAANRLTENGTFLINVIDYEGRLEAVASIVATLKRVFPVVELWTNTTPPTPDQRLVFVVAAGWTPTKADRFTVPAPERTQFGALADGFVTRLAKDKGTVLSDDYAPIDRLIGRPD